MAPATQKENSAWRGAGDPDPVGWVLSPESAGGVVHHRGFAYPAAFSWTWTRTDGLEVVLAVEVDEGDGPVPVSLSIRSEGGIRSDDYRLPFASMAWTAAAQYAVEVREGAPGTYEVSPAVGEIPMGQTFTAKRITKRTDAERLERIADLYRQARAEGLGVTELIERPEPDGEGVGRSQAYGLIRQARRAGLLAPSRPGRKAKHGEEGT